MKSVSRNLCHGNSEVKSRTLGNIKYISCYVCGRQVDYGKPHCGIVTELNPNPFMGNNPEK